jgi:hypothetical protein
MTRAQGNLLGLVVFVMLTAGPAGTARALDLEAPGQSDISVHGFVSQGFIKSTGNDYLVTSKRGSFDFSDAGINFTTQVNDRLRLGLQLFAFNLGALGNYRVTADWYYIDYRLRDWFGVRAGRLKLPLGLYTDISDIDSARVSILLPSALYTATSRDYFLAHTGAEIYGYVGLRRLGALDYRVYGGSVAIDLPSQLGSPILVTSVGVPFIGGARATWETPLEGLRIGGSALYGRVEANYVIPMLAPVRLTSDVYGAVGSVEYAVRDLLLQGEYSQTRNENESSNTMVVPTLAVVSEGMYFLAAYRVARWLQPGAYYSLYHPNRNVRSGRENVQHDVTGTLRFDINQNWLIKLEGHYMRGTARLAGDAPARAALPENWAVFLIKTTATF